MSKKFGLILLPVALLTYFICSLCLPIQPSYATGTSVTLDGSSGGRTFDGEGVLSGGGGNSRLLIDYPEPYRSEILDYLFKPNYGASFTTLKVEVGGDMNSTTGTEPSHARTEAENASPNMNRGYELWLMSEAKKRNPAIKLDILEWGAPAWVGSMWSQKNADYLVSYIKGAKSVWGLDIDYVGGNQNENSHGTSKEGRDYIVNILRPTLDRNGLTNVRIIAPDVLSTNWALANQVVTDTALKNALTAIGYHYVKTSSTANAQNSGLPIWESEGWTGVGDWNGAYALARELNDNYVKAQITKTNVWHLIDSSYDNLSWPGSGIMVANSPWSGTYKVMPSVWAEAHTNQFVQPGWKYLDSGTGTTAGNTSYVTLKQPDASGNYSVILDTGSAAESITFNLTGGLTAGSVHVWKSNSTAQFIQQPDITPANGSFTINLDPNSIYSLTTTTGQHKGAAAHAVPASAGFPSPYAENFEGYAVGTTPRYTQDEQGAFEVADRYGGGGKALRQLITGPVIEWDVWSSFKPNQSAYTQFGDMTWKDYDYSADVLIENSGSVSIIGRISDQGRTKKQESLQKGYKLVVNDSGNWSLRIGDPIALPADETVLASGTFPFSANTWHNLKLSFAGSTIKAFIDNSQVASVTDTTYASGLVALGSGWNNAQYDNISVNEAAKPNLALNKPATADSEETSKSHEAVKGNDGSTSTRWTAANGNLNHWWKVDLGSVKTLSGTEVQWEHSNVYQYKIEVSSDNASWTTVVDRTASSVAQKIQRDDFTASGRYVRMTVTGLAAGEWASFYEMKVF